jgi:hypothetical protein
VGAQVTSQIEALKQHLFDYALGSETLHPQILKMLESTRSLSQQQVRRLESAKNAT